MTRVQRYNSVAEAFDHYDGLYNDPESSNNPTFFDYWYRCDDDWAGGTHKETAHWVRNGSPEYGDSIREAIANLGSVAIPNRETWKASPVGFLPNVPAYVSGSPNSMWRRTMGEQPRPVRVFVSGFVSGFIGHEDIARRGAAIAALVDYLKARAPVELHFYLATSARTYASSDVVLSMRLQSGTLDPDLAGFLFCSPAQVRRFTAPLAAALGGENSGPPYTGDIRAVLGVGGRDILVPDMLSNDEHMYTPDWVRTIAEQALQG